MKSFVLYLFVILISPNLVLAKDCPEEYQLRGEFIVSLKSESDQIEAKARKTNVQTFLDQNMISAKPLKIDSSKDKKSLKFQKTKSTIFPTLLHIKSKEVSKFDLEQFEDVEKVEYNCIAKLFKTPNDELYPSLVDLYAFDVMKAELAWDISTGSNSVVVAVIDSGVDYSHEDLKDNIWVNSGEIPGDGIDNDGNNFIDDVHGYDFGGTIGFSGNQSVPDADGDPMPGKTEVGLPTNTQEANSIRLARAHGTHVAGIVGARGNNGKGVPGTVWNVKIMAVKGFGDDTDGASLIDLANGIVYAVNNGAHVINASFGVPGDPNDLSSALLFLKDAVKYAKDNNVVFVTAAGNDAIDAGTVFPAGFEESLTVGSTTQNDRRSCFSNFGKTVDMFAPGGNLNTPATADPRLPSCDGAREDVLSTWPGNVCITGACGSNKTNVNGTYAGIQGTSMSAPYVAGAIALIKSINPNLSAKDLRDIVTNSGDIVHLDTPSTSFQRYTRLNLYSAAKLARDNRDLGTPIPRVSPAENFNCKNSLCTLNASQMNDLSKVITSRSSGCSTANVVQLEADNIAFTADIGAQMYIVLLFFPFLVFIRIRRSN